MYEILFVKIMSGKKGLLEENEEKEEEEEEEE